MNNLYFQCSVWNVAVRVRVKPDQKAAQVQWKHVFTLSKGWLAIRDEKAVWPGRNIWKAPATFRPTIALHPKATAGWSSKKADPGSVFAAVQVNINQPPPMHCVHQLYICKSPQRKTTMPSVDYCVVLMYCFRQRWSQRSNYCWINSVSWHLVSL